MRMAGHLLEMEHGLQTLQRLPLEHLAFVTALQVLLEIATLFLTQKKIHLMVFLLHGNST